MVTLDRLEKKIDALTAGVNSLLAAQQNYKKEPTDERHAVLCAKLDGSHKDLQAGIISVKGQLDGIRDGLVDKIKQLTCAVRVFAAAKHRRQAKHWENGQKRQKKSKAGAKPRAKRRKK